MPMVLPVFRYAARPRRWPSSSTPPSDSEVQTMPADGTKVAVRADDGSLRVIEGS